MIARLAIAAWLCALARPASADPGKLAKEGLRTDGKALDRGKRKLCCGYPLSGELGFKITFYWMAEERDHALEDDDTDIYTADGWFLGSFPRAFVDELKMEGSAWLVDGRVINYAGRCRLGVGTCFETLDRRRFPYGRGNGQRPLAPFQSIAVDRRLVAIGETLYLPEFDGMPLPGGGIHDGCVRADDTGGAIKHRLFDFFVVQLPNFRWVRDHLWGLRYATPSIEDPRCDYLRDPR